MDKLLIFGIAVLVIVIALLTVTILNDDFIFWTSPLQQSKFIPILIPCDENCKIKNENKGMTCTQIHPEDYMCKAPLIIDPRSRIQFSYVAPIDYGEFVYYPIKTDVNSIIEIEEIIDKNTIKIKFSSSNDWNLPNEFEFISNVSKGETFVMYCTDKTLHTMTFTDIIEMEENTYVEFWARLAITPEGLVCNYPKIIQHSLKHDFGI